MKSLANGLIVLIILILVSGCTSFKTPEIKGIVVDAETGKPLANVNVIASWSVGVATLAGLADIHSVKKYKIKTDQNGEFVIPQVRGKKKAINGTFEGINILVYVPGYNSAYLSNFLAGTRGYNRDKRKPSFKLVPLKTKDDYLEVLQKTPWNLVDEFLGDLEFLNTLRYDYIFKYPEDKKAALFFEEIVYYYENQKDVTGINSFFKKLMNEYPGTYISGRAEEKLKLLNKEVIK